MDAFVRAVSRVEGLEWLVEYSGTFPQDDDFGYAVDEDEPAVEGDLGGRLYLVMSNGEALEQLLRLWQLYTENEEHRFPRGLAPFKEVFKRLRNIRPWGREDRLVPEVLEDWSERVAEGAESVRVEVELWFRRTPGARGAAEERVSDLVLSLGGSVVARSSIEAIAYHALLAELPISAVAGVAEHPDTQLVNSGDVMFFRPASQLAVRTPIDIDAEAPRLADTRLPTGPAVAALLDGYPMVEHEALAGRVIIDDPDDWAADCPPGQRVHGTSMASLIVHGDMHAPESPIGRPLYVRPILKPLPTLNPDQVDERMPSEELPVDLVHRAVRRLFVGAGEEPPQAPAVRVVNFSVGDSSRLFDREMSPLARLLDWLAAEHNVLFVVSAGNHLSDVVLDLPLAEARQADGPAIERHTLLALARDAHNRRLLSPAESVNALTVAAAQADRGGPNGITTIRELVQSEGHPSPISAMGLGYGRSVKPDILMPGGRAHYRESLRQGAGSRYTLVNSARAPGQRSASPGAPGNLRSYTVSCGTSNAAALATRASIQLMDVLRELQRPGGERGVPDEFLPVMLRALLVHSAEWGPVKDSIFQALTPLGTGRRLRQDTARLVGYGLARPERVMGCTDERATLISFGKIQGDAAHHFTLPLPADLAGRRLKRRLAVSLAWLTPVNPESRAYRRVRLWVDVANESLLVRRADLDNHAPRRGSVQHEVFEGEQATAFGANEELSLSVSCKCDSGFSGAVRYAIVATLEVAPGENVRVYEQIRQRLAVPVSVAPRARA